MDEWPIWIMGFSIGLMTGTLFWRIYLFYVEKQEAKKGAKGA